MNGDRELEQYLSRMRTRRFRPPSPLNVVEYVASGADTLPVTRSFTVPTPDVRARTRVTLLCVGGPGITIDPFTSTPSSFFGALTVWASLREQCQGAKNWPVQNLVGTRAAPVTFPTDAGLWGISFELETAGQQILGRVGSSAAPGSSNTGGSVKLVVDYAALEAMHDNEWQQLCAKAHPSVERPILVAGT